MTVAALAALLAALPPGLDLLEGAARYRVELSGAAVGVATLSVRCLGAQGCRVTWRASLRLPADAGGGLRARELATALDEDGRIAAVLVDGVPAGAPDVPPDSYPASAAELVLSRARAGRCLTVFEEGTARSGSACLLAVSGEVRRMTVLGVEELVRPGADGFPARVDIPAQGAAYVRDPAAEVPSQVPLSVRVLGAAAAVRFCGRAADPELRGAPPTGLPPVHPDGRSCQAQAAAYAAAARRRGLAARIAVGVAHDGQGFVWHAWTEVRAGGGWVAVDPAFGQRPARGPRFTVARHGGDPASQGDAGRKILACWGRQME